MDRGQEIRELKLGASFTNPNNARTMYHTLKYDFKPASVDVHKEATLETGSNSQVTVTVPHLDGSGVPNTIYKGSGRDYTKKECVLIFNKETNEIILEKLCSNIQVKKTRTDSSNKPQPAIITQKIENQTARQSSKTRVSTGTVRKNVLNYVPKHSPLQQQGSPSYPHRSPQQSTSWTANSNVSSLPSITSLLDDSAFASNQTTPMYNNNNTTSNKSNNSNSITNNISTPSAASNMLSKATASAIQSSQQQQSHQMAVDDIGVLSSSESSSDSNDDSDSDSDDSVDSVDNHAMNNNKNSISNIINNSSSNNNNNNNIANIANHNSNSNHKKVPTSMSNHLNNNSKADLLTKDLCLSDSDCSDF